MASSVMSQRVSWQVSMHQAGRTPAGKGTDNFPKQSLTGARCSHDDLRCVGHLSTGRVWAGELLKGLDSQRGKATSLCSDSLVRWPCGVPIVRKEDLARGGSQQQRE